MKATFLDLDAEKAGDKKMLKFYIKAVSYIGTNTFFRVVELPACFSRF